MFCHSMGIALQKEMLVRQRSDDDCGTLPTNNPRLPYRWSAPPALPVSSSSATPRTTVCCTPAHRPGWTGPWKAPRRGNDADVIRYSSTPRNGGCNRATRREWSMPATNLHASPSAWSMTPSRNLTARRSSPATWRRFRLSHLRKETSASTISAARRSGCTWIRSREPSLELSPLQSSRTVLERRRADNES